MLFMSYFGKGAFSINDLYNMPVFLRMNYLNELNLLMKEEADAHKTAMKR